MADAGSAIAIAEPSLDATVVLVQQDVPRVLFTTETLMTGADAECALGLDIIVPRGRGADLEVRSITISLEIWRMRQTSKVNTSTCIADKFNHVLLFI